MLLVPGTEQHHYATFAEIRTTMARLFYYLHDQKVKIALLVIILILSAGFELTPALILKTLIDRVLPNGDKELFALCLVAFFCASLAIAATAYAQSYLIQHLAQKIVLGIRTQLHAHLQYLPLKFYDKQGTGRIMARVMEDTGILENTALNGMITLFFAPIQITFILVILFLKQPTLAWLVLAPVPLLAVISIFYVLGIRRSFRKARMRSENTNAILHDNLSGIREVKIYNQQEYESSRFSAACETYMGARMKNISLIAQFGPAMGLATGIGTLLVMGWGGYLCLQGTITTGDLVLFYLYMSRYFYGPVIQLARVNAMFQSTTIAAERVFELMDEPVEEPDPTPSSKLACPAGEISFNHITFAYPEREPVFQDLSFTFPAGKLTAIVGPSGAGKSTLAKLIARFYLLSQGTITIDGEDIREVSLDSLREHIGMVLQESMLFNDTAGNNIRYGKLEASQDEIIQAAKFARAHEFILELPNGYDTIVGERGIKLSGGQRQRIAIARVLLKNPRILILDDATSSVDPETETLIQEAIYEVTKDRTSVVIAHRTSTIEKADHILHLS